MQMMKQKAFILLEVLVGEHALMKSTLISGCSREKTLTDIFKKQSNKRLFSE